MLADRLFCVLKPYFKGFLMPSAFRKLQLSEHPKVAHTWHEESIT